MDVRFEYYDDKKNVREDLLTVKAEECAKAIRAGDTPTTQTQMRRFYDEAKSLERRYKNYGLTGGDSAELKKESFAKILPFIKLLKAKSDYAYKRGVMRETFKNWLWANVDKIREPRDFETFMLFFEAVYGFAYKKQGEKN